MTLNAAKRKRLVVEAVPGCAPEIGRMLWLLGDARDRTRRGLDGIDAAAIDRTGGANGHSIGTLLYHVAAIEMDWLATDVMEGKLPDHVWDAFPYDVRDDTGRLTHVSGYSLNTHLQRLKGVRGLLLEVYRAMTLEDYRRVRFLPDYDVTPEWVLHHLCQHEAEHRDEIIALRAAAEANRNKD
jgi:uncharacterized damage-inducible protein DinB